MLEISCDHRSVAVFPEDADAKDAAAEAVRRSLHDGRGELCVRMNVRVRGGVKLNFFKDKTRTASKFYACFHTAFLDGAPPGGGGGGGVGGGTPRLVLRRREISKAVKDDEGKTFPEGFGLVLEFAPCVEVATLRAREVGPDGPAPPHACWPNAFLTVEWR